MRFFLKLYFSKFVEKICFVEKMSKSGQLRSENQKLLQKLKQSQVEISRLIVSAKHSDPRILERAPLTSTVANRNGGDALLRSGRLLMQARRTAAKSPGILKKKQKPKRVRLPTPILRSPAQDNPTSPKYEVISQFLKQQSDKGKNLTFSDTPRDQPMLADPGNSRPFRARETTKEPKSILVKTPQQNTRKKTNNEDHDKSDINNEAPLLGYDWIAGLMDNNDPTSEQTDSFIEEMKEFRKLNRSDCQSKRAWNDRLRTPKTPLQDNSPITRLQRHHVSSPDPSDTRDPRIINYTINKRLFPVPVDPNDAGSPGTEGNPRYIRVSIPKCSLISPYRYKPRAGVTNGEGADTLSLPHHCAPGWQNTVPKRAVKKQDDVCLDLRASLHPTENLANLRLKSGQSDLRGGIKASDYSESFLDRSYSIQYRLKKLRNEL